MQNIPSNQKSRRFSNSGIVGSVSFLVGGLINGAFSSSDRVIGSLWASAACTGSDAQGTDRKNTNPTR